MIVAIEVKYCVIPTCILSIVLCKFHHEQEFYLIVLLLIDKYVKISFYYHIFLLSLAVCLRIKDNGKYLHNTAKVA